MPPSQFKEYGPYQIAHYYYYDDNAPDAAALYFTGFHVIAENDVIKQATAESCKVHKYFINEFTSEDEEKLELEIQQFYVRLR